MIDFLKKFSKSFVYAARGFGFAVTHERNFRIHIVAILYTLGFAVIYGLTGYEYGVLVLTFALVPAMELINTAVENAVNAKTEEYSKFAAIAKDTSAAAVLVAAVAAIGVAVSLFSDIEKLKSAFGTIFSMPNVLWLILTFVPVGAFLILCGKKR